MPFDIFELPTVERNPFGREAPVSSVFGGFVRNLPFSSLSLDIKVKPNLCFCLKILFLSEI